LQHDYPILTQRIFAIIFSLIALVAPVLGVTFSDSFGVRAGLVQSQEINKKHSNREVDFHQKLFCSDWAGNCREQDVIRKVHSLLGR
jgi:hypothetical protein